MFERCPEAWRGRGNILAAAAGVFAQFGDDGFAKAIELHLRAVGAPATDTRSYPSVRALEQLANFEARRSGKVGDKAGVARAAARLERMVAVLSKEPGARLEDLPPPSSELCGLVGRCWKGLATTALREAKAATAPGARADKPSRAKPSDGRKVARELIDQARVWYARGESLHDRGHQGRYCAINHLALTVVTGHANGTPAALDALTTASLAGFAKVSLDDRVWEGFIPADAALLRALLDGKLADRATFDGLVKRYLDDRRALSPSDRQWDSVATQPTLLADLTEVDGCPPRIRAQAPRLRELAKQLTEASA